MSFLFDEKRSGVPTFNHYQFKLPFVIVGHIYGSGRLGLAQK